MLGLVVERKGGLEGVVGIGHVDVVKVVVGTRAKVILQLFFEIKAKDSGGGTVG